MNQSVSSQPSSSSKSGNSEKLISQDNVLGWERNGVFEAVTNFEIEVSGYVADSGNIIGYVVSIKLAVKDPLSSFCNNVKSFHLTNRELGNHQAIINVLTKCKALWISQSQKEPFLPQHIYSLCKEYIKIENPKRFTPVKIIGKQPGDDVWVFNQQVHMTGDGCFIEDDERTYLLIEEDFSKLPQLKGVTGEFDEGEALKELILAERELFNNNFPQVVMTHALSGIAANYDLVVKELDGCAIPFIQGEPVSGKTTAMKAALSLFGIDKFNSECTAKSIEQIQSVCAIPFGWDDVDNMKTFRSIVINSYNAGGSSNVRTKLIPHTVPMVTSNSNFDDIKIKSRLFKINFEKPHPILTGVELERAENGVRAAMANAHKSIAILTCHLHHKIKERLEDEDYGEIVSKIELLCKANKVDIRAQRMFILMLFCCKKMLDAIGLEDMFLDVANKVENLIIPAYNQQNKMKEEKKQKSGVMIGEEIKELLQVTLPKVAIEGVEEEVLKFFENDFKPKGCMCGTTLGLHPRKFLDYCQTLEEDTKGITENAVRAFIKANDIGCVGKKMRFRGEGVMTSAIHFQRKWMPMQAMESLDAKFGTRLTKGGESNNADKAVTASSSIPSREDNSADNVTDSNGAHNVGKDVSPVAASKRIAAREDNGADNVTDSNGAHNVGKDVSPVAASKRIAAREDNGADNVTDSNGADNVEKDVSPVAASSSIPSREDNSADNVTDSNGADNVEKDVLSPVAASKRIAIASRGVKRPESSRVSSRIAAKRNREMTTRD